MNTYTCNTFKGYWPVGTAAVVIACSPNHAADKLNEKLVAMKLPGNVKPEQMIPFPAGDESVRILCDGNY